MQENHFDTVIIGAGPAGNAAAYSLSPHQKVMIIESDLWGGTCPNRGCDPKKILYGVINEKLQEQRFSSTGLKSQSNIDWPALMKFKRSYTDSVPTGTKSGLKSAGVATIHGSASFVNSHTVMVDQKQISADNFIIATGAFPAIPDLPGKNLFATSDDFLSMKQLPKTIGFVGSGFVAIELANIARVSGATVHIFQHNDRILRRFSTDYTNELAKILSERGIKFHWNSQIKSLTENNGSVSVKATDGETKVDMMISAIGRPANIKGLNLAKIGIKASSKGIKVNNHLQTSLSNIYAVGDVIDKTQPKLTPVASLEGKYAAENILKQKEPISYPAVPEIVFSSPELAEVGVSLETAQAQTNKYKILNQQVGGWYSYHRLMDQNAQVATIIDKDSGLLVGAVVLSVNAEELINYFTEIINDKVSPTDVSARIPIYPSTASDLSYFYF